MFLLTLWQPLLLDRLLRRQLWRYFGAILLILIAILISFRLSNLLSAAAKGDIALSAIVPMIALQMLRFILLLAPIVYVLASALVLGLSGYTVALNTQLYARVALAQSYNFAPCLASPCLFQR